MITPVHRFQGIDNTTITNHQSRRPYVQPMTLQRVASNQNNQCQSQSLGDSVNEPATSRQPPTPELEAPIYLNAPLDNALNSVPHAQLMRLGGLTKYGMWASFGLTTVSGTFEILLLCTLGVLSVGLLVSCLLTVLIEIPEVMPQREMIITPVTANLSQQSTIESRSNHDLEQPPPPYEIAILLPNKKHNFVDYPPPTYENAIR
ncbi:hypothetical protein Phum_PHUM174970 [Pediculus humanus corporis]|uniref:Uncharacterized protein n=1 Tax=Pediculus humanus subsp. corporis TaxID=121224 RepID=E0VG75_PEDHC|nr:uncharacterized protein Phum_PHUM174970 [Pediculus humanus corporis]EEB12381.1 hypothetical protein Phum_PHUM174970 [Pediculus humanus corporis]